MILAISSPPGAAMTLATAAWRLATTLATPLLRWHLVRRVRRGKELRPRLAERRGLAAARPPGRLLWLHAASVGEAISTLPVLEALLAREGGIYAGLFRRQAEGLAEVA